MITMARILAAAGRSDTGWCAAKQGKPACPQRRQVPATAWFSPQNCLAFTH